MKTDTKAYLIDFIKKNNQSSPAELQKHLQISPQALHRHLKTLVELGHLKRVGKPPSVFYLLVDHSLILPKVEIDPDDIFFLEERYTYINPKGRILEGLDGFREWAENTKQGKYLSSLVKEFIKVRKESDEFFNTNHLIDATKKFSSTFSDNALDEIYYSDFYSLPKFGKTPLGALVLYAKQAQDRKLVQKIANQCRKNIERLIKEKKIQALAWAPHSIPRKIQFLKELRAQWNFQLPEIVFSKAYEGEVPVAQKSLSKLEERIQNANSTLFPKISSLAFNKILIVDDAVGSGSTLEAMAKKLKKMNSKIHVIGYAIVGSLKGFEVIKEI